MAIVGGLSAQKQDRLIRSDPDVIVATPGRLWELLTEGNTTLSLRKIEFLVLDEADRMVGNCALSLSHLYSLTLTHLGPAAHASSSTNIC